MDTDKTAYFEALTHDREENARILAKRSMRGFWNSVVEKYSEQAHFVYELLQNADDAGATEARFELSEDQLLFAHNGKRHFSITDPSREEEDTEAGELGDINAITSIANSTKGDESTIGKFGVGFKAVFQYTSTPRIYGPGVAFRIEHIIVPRLLERDHPNRRVDETLFVFPFDRTGMPSDTAAREIGERLSALEHPTLFLRNLSKIRYTTPSAEGCFSKRTLTTYKRDGVTAELLRLSMVENGSESIDDLWLMSSTAQDGLTCSAGFFIDEQGLLKPVERSAYCFFPTKVRTGLNFVVNAPFLLTDSREGIRVGDSHNVDMVGRLARLSAESLVILRDLGEERGTRVIGDNLFDVIPYDWGQNDWLYKKPVKKSFSFNRICEAMAEQLRSERLLPGTDGYYRPEDAYMLETKRLSDLIAAEQIRTLTGEGGAGWVLPSTYYRALPSSLRTYLRDLGVTAIDDGFIMRRIDPRFVSSQSLRWLSRLHSYLSETSARIDQARHLPVFVDSEGRAAAAYDRDGNEILFLPAEGADDVTVIEPASLELEGTKRLADSLGLKAPSLKARVLNRILPSYESGRDPRDVAAFRAVYQCYLDAGESQAFLREISGYPLLACVTQSGPVANGVTPSEAYLPDEQLTEYFLDKRDAVFVDMAFYRGIVGDADKTRRFLDGLSVAKRPRIVDRQVWPWSVPELRDRTWEYCSQNQPESWHEHELDGCAEILDAIVRELDTERSVTLWKMLLGFAKHDCRSSKPDDLLRGEHRYFYYSPGREAYTPTLTLRLRSRRWLVDRGGTLVSPEGLERTSLSERYDTTSEEGKIIADYLGIVEPVAKELSEGERMASDLDAMARRMGIENFGNLMSNRSFMAKFESLVREYGHPTPEQGPEGYELASSDAGIGMRESSGNAWAGQRPTRTHLSDLERIFESVQEADGTEDEPPARRDDGDAHVEGGEGPAVDKQKVRVRSHFRSLPGGGGLEGVADDIERRVSRRRMERNGDSASGHSRERDEVGGKRGRAARASNDTSRESDDDALIPAVVDYEKRTERRRERCARDIDGIEREERLRNSAILAETYSYKWFKCLIELESVYGEDKSGRTEFGISFGKVRLEEGSERTLVLEQPDRPIPRSVEDLSNIPLSLELPDRTARVEIEVASVRNYTLRARLKDGAKLGGIELPRVEEARIEVRSPTFLLEELRRRFDELGLEDSFNMRDGLPENIEFVFGPPGTGKTTHLARGVLLPLMESDEDLRVLVLAPTNKAADVLARKVVECAGGADGCSEWLVRFGATDDAMLEESGLYRDKTFDLTSLGRCVTITTVARYPYDYVLVQGGRRPIRDIEWDYVIFDEASMISCAQITYPLHKARPRRFVVAGDPHQISPVAKVDLWQDENIYTMVGLDSFKSPRTVPHDYKVTLLTTQHRSVPAIGRVFSELSYDGLLTSSRTEGGTERGYLGGILPERPINVIRFPVSPYESVYRPKQLNRKSAYQPYAAILTYELVRRIAQNASTIQSGKNLSIGVVTPYRAQADLLSGLLAQSQYPANVSVQAGTIHGFQGDECDVMIVVLNTPPTITAGSGMFLNRRNILNVSVSRARDSLILIVPDEDTRNRENLREVSRLESICARTHALGVTTAARVEEALFGSSTFIEENCFSTGHQSVNVYGRPDQRYEIRSESHAIDLQIHDDDLPTVADSRYNGSRAEGMVQAGSAALDISGSPENVAERAKPVYDGEALASKAHARKAEPEEPEGRVWTVSELRALKTKYGLYSNLPLSLLLAFPGWTLREIDAKALELGLISELPNRG